MLTRHLNELMTRLEQVNDVGCAQIRKTELALWYNRDRITKGVWADLYEKWQEINDETLLLVGDSEGIWVLAYGRGLKVTSYAWFRDIRHLAGITTLIDADIAA